MLGHHQHVVASAQGAGNDLHLQPPFHALRQWQLALVRDRSPFDAIHFKGWAALNMGCYIRAARWLQVVGSQY